MGGRALTPQPLSATERGARRRKAAEITPPFRMGTRTVEIGGENTAMTLSPPPVAPVLPDSLPTEPVPPAEPTLPAEAEAAPSPEPVAAALPAEPPRPVEDAASRLDHLYTAASDLELELENAARRGHILTAGQIGAFNSILHDCRDLLPKSVALREDVEEIDEPAKARTAEVYRALHVTIVPTLHNALPEDFYRRHG